MRPENQIPVQSNPLDRPIKRHHSARYYSHRVKESLTTQFSKLVCSVFLTLLFLVGIITFILWLSLRPHRPRFHVQDFSIPDPNRIVYNVMARNSNQNVGVYYDSMHVAVFYEDQSIAGVPVLFPFYQKPKNTTAITGQLSGPALTGTGQPWQQIVAALPDGKVVLRLQVTSVIRFKISTWDSKRHRMHADCPVGVGPDGSLLPSYRVNRCRVYFGGVLN